MNLDLSKFKKVACDKKTTTLRHDKGHEIRIAHGGLTPKLRSQLDKIPLHAADGTGPVEQPLDDSSPAAADDAPDDAATPPADASAPAPTNQQDAGAPQDGAPPSANEVVVTGQRKTPQQLNADDAAFAQDLALGKITPETYESLFAKKDTLGKMGTLFGLLVSGAGSGLAHQPNAVLGMMDKTLDRDLDAQKASNVNAQQWYQMSLQHQLQEQVQIPQAQSAMAAQAAESYGRATEADLTRAKLARVGGIDMNASDAAKNNMMMVFRQNAQNNINKLPPGQSRDAAQNKLDTQVTPAIISKVNENNVKRAARNAAAAPAPAQQQPQTGAGHAIDYDKLNQMVEQSRVDSSMGIPPRRGEASEGDIGGIQKEASGIEDNRVTASAYDHAFKRLWNAPDKGSLNEEAYKAEINTLSAQIARETAGRFNLSEAQQQTGGMFPNWKDYVSGAGQEKYNNTMNYFKGNEAGTATLNRFPALKTPFPKFQSPFKDKTPAGPTDGTVGADKNGRPTVWRGGKQYYK